jgi:hypothetical protein
MYILNEGQYIELISHSKIKCEEKLVKVYFDNPLRNEVRRIKVDDGLIKDKTVKKCDYMVICNNHIHRFIELKGSDLDDAEEQILSTNVILKNELTKKAKKGYIILNQIPVSSSEKQIREKAFLNKNKFPLEFHSSGKTLPL